MLVFKTSSSSSRSSAIAERRGFEPLVRSYPHTSLAVRHLKPTRTTLQSAWFWLRSKLSRASTVRFHQISLPSLTGVRGFEGRASWFTVSPLWPLGNPPVFSYFLYIYYIKTFWKNQILILVGRAGLEPTTTCSQCKRKSCCYGLYLNHSYNVLYPLSYLPKNKAHNLQESNLWK